MPVVPDHFSGMNRGGNVPPDPDPYSKSVGGDTPGDGRMAGVQSLVLVSLSPRPDDLTMQADRGRTNEGVGFRFAASASECDCIRARSPRVQKIDNGTKNDGASLNLGDSKRPVGSSRTVLLFFASRIGNQKFAAVEQSIDLRPESREFPLISEADRYGRRPSRSPPP